MTGAYHHHWKEGLSTSSVDLVLMEHVSEVAAGATHSVAERGSRSVLVAAEAGCRADDGLDPQTDELVEAGCSCEWQVVLELG